MAELLDRITFKGTVLSFFIALALWACWYFPYLTWVPLFLAAIALPPDWMVNTIGRKTSVLTIILTSLIAIIVSVAFVFVPMLFALQDLLIDPPEILQKFISSDNALKDLTAQFQDKYDLADKPVSIVVEHMATMVTDTVTNFISHGALGHTFHMAIGPLHGAAEFLIMFVLFASALGYWEKMMKDTNSVLNAFDVSGQHKARLTSIAQHIQQIGRKAMLGYLNVVMILIPVYTLFFWAASFLPIPGDTKISYLTVILLGFFFGIFGSIPGLGTKLALAAVVIVGLVQYGLTIWVAAIFPVFGFGVTFLESKILTPKKIGEALGMNPYTLLMVIFVGLFWLKLKGPLVAIVLCIVCRAFYLRVKEEKEHKEPKKAKKKAKKT